MILSFIFSNHFFVYLGFLIMQFSCSQANDDITHGINDLMIFYKTKSFKSVNILSISMSAVYRRLYLIYDQNRFFTDFFLYSLNYYYYFF